MAYACGVRSFDIDDRKLRQAEEHESLWWNRTLAGKFFLGSGMLLACSAALAAIAAIIAVLVLVPGVGLGLVIFMLIILLTSLVEARSEQRR